MQKDIIGWSHKKLDLDKKQIGQVPYRERQVWWMKIGHNVGSEQNGSLTTYSRPVVIVRGFSSSLFWGVPMSTTSRRGPYDKEVLVEGSVSIAVLSQLRALDTRRIGSYVGMISLTDLQTLKDDLKTLLN